MVSLWPFGKATDETANFERTLATLNTKIQKTNVRRDQLRNCQRRYKALWTLYTTLAYIVCFLILALVTGWQNWSPIEYAVVIGSPVVIYLVRTGLSAYYTSRLIATQGHLDDLNNQRETAIEKFKAATKYNSTQQLLEKYGAAPPSASRSSSPGRPSPKRRTPSSGGSSKTQAGQRQPARTGIPPPATANIRRPQAEQIAVPPQTPTGQTSSQPRTYGSPLLNSLPPLATEPSASFAPNAFPSSPQYAAAPSSSLTHGETRWYDRIMDVILGEDETRPANRMALICTHCRLVNGQAPPGVKRLEEVGRWRCAECHSWNGKENVVQQILQDVKKEDSVGAESAKALHEEMTEKRTRGVGYDGAADEDIFTDKERSAEPPSTASGAEEEEEEVDDTDDIEEEDVSPPPETKPKRGRKPG